MQTTSQTQTRDRVATTRRVELVRSRHAQGMAWALLVVTGLNVALNSFARPLLGAGVQDVTLARLDPAITPAPWAFAIWGPIFAALLAYAVYNVRRPHDARLAAARAPMIASMAAGAAWPVATARGDFVSGMALIAVMGAGAAMAWGPTHAGPSRGWADRLLGRWPVSLYLGWLSVALLVSVTGVLTNEAGLASPLAPDVMAAIGVGVAGALGVVFGVARRDGVYAVPIAWALVAIAVAQQSALVTGTAGGAIAAMALALITGHRLRPNRSF